MPEILRYNEVAMYMEGKQTKEKMQETIISSARILLQSKYKAGRINELLLSFSDSIPLEIEEIKASLFLHAEN